MIHPYEWSEYQLIVCIRNRQSGANHFLLSGMSQDAFIEHWIAMWEEERDARIYEMTVTPITQDVYDLLVPVYEADRVLEG